MAPGWASQEGGPGCGSLVVRVKRHLGGLLAVVHILEVGAVCSAYKEAEGAVGSSASAEHKAGRPGPQRN